jgi:ribonuclease Z
MGPSQVVECGDELILVDCGSGVAQRLVEAGYGRRSISHLLITHLHSDHITGLPDLLWGGWVGRWWEKPPTIVGPVGTRHMVEHLLKAFEVDIHVRSERADGEQLPLASLVPEIEELREGWSATGRDCQMEAFYVDHKPVEEAFGFRIDMSNASLAISGDTRRSENLIAHSQGVDALVHEVIRLSPDDSDIGDDWAKRRREAVNAYHTDSREVGGIASEVNTRHLILSHLILRVGRPTDLITDVRPSFKGKVTVGEDLQSFQIRPNNSKAN